ncbi:MAG: diaminopimelate epimerase [Rhodobacterales bacterium CG15_BIG_FIL_POST_REV_8_21_14_020_59_13]|nr:MAG: diaminopimelate epimerase [Rhodobacterales bacterium CG15_BIG_FIL_POST_REV_8_21_14_020_59_13]
MRALKMNGTGNAFLLVDARKQTFAVTPERVCDLAEAYDFDQLLVLETSTDADARYRIWNRDGGEVGACGNGARCAGWYLTRQSGTDTALLDTAYGLTQARRTGDFRISVDLGPALTKWQDIPLARVMETIALDYALESGGIRVSQPGAVSMGNPHIVFGVAELSGLPVEMLGSMAEHDPLFPEGVNAGFMQILNRTHIRLRVWERGAGLTKACGTGAAAAIVAGHRKGLLDRQCHAAMDGGDLFIDWREDNHVWLEGPVELEGGITL